MVRYTYKNGCNGSITINYKHNKHALEVTELFAEHNHDRSETIFTGLPKQRRLDADEKDFVDGIIKMKPNMRLLQKEMKEKTGKTVLLKDLHNLKQSAALTGKNDLEAIFDQIKNKEDVFAEIFVTGDELEGIFTNENIL